MKNIFLTFILFSTLLTAFAQSNCSIKKAYAFYTITVPGVAMVDENGNVITPEPTVNRFIFIEWSGSKNPEIESIKYDKDAYSVSITAVEGNTVIPGEEIKNNSKYKITSNTCNSLWKIDVYPKDDTKKVKQDCKNILIRIKTKDKPCEFKLLKETELMSLPRY